MSIRKSIPVNKNLYRQVGFRELENGIFGGEYRMQNYFSLRMNVVSEDYHFVIKLFPVAGFRRLITIS